MKNAEEVANDLAVYSRRDSVGCVELKDAIAKALQDAYRKGAEDMRLRAADVAEKRVVHNPRLDYDAGWNRAANLIEDEIRYLPITEGGGR